MHGLSGWIQAELKVQVNEGIIIRTGEERANLLRRNL